MDGSLALNGIDKEQENECVFGRDNAGVKRETTVGK